jgi:type VI protein secretion system component VasF
MPRAKLSVAPLTREATPGKVHLRNEGGQIVATVPAGIPGAPSGPIARLLAQAGPMLALLEELAAAPNKHRPDALWEEVRLTIHRAKGAPQNKAEF